MPKLKIKDIDLLHEIPETGQKLMKVVLEDEEGHQEEFAIDLWEMLDEDHFAEILLNWRDRILPLRKLAKNIPSDKALQAKQLAGIEIDDIDDKITVAMKISDVIAQLKTHGKFKNQQS